MFSALPQTNFKFSLRIIRLSANAFCLDQSKFLGFGKELNMATMIRFVSDRLENIVGKEDSAFSQQLLLFKQCFRKSNILELLKKCEFLVKG